MCTDKLHLSHNDQRSLRSIRIERWDCPGCSKPKLRVEEDRDSEDHSERPGESSGEAR